MPVSLGITIGQDGVATCSWRKGCPHPVARKAAQILRRETEEGGNGVLASDRRGNPHRVVRAEGHGDAARNELADGMGLVRVSRSQHHITREATLDRDPAAGNLLKQPGFSAA